MIDRDHLVAIVSEHHGESATTAAKLEDAAGGPAELAARQFAIVGHVGAAPAVFVVVQLGVGVVLARPGIDQIVGEIVIDRSHGRSHGRSLGRLLAHLTRQGLFAALATATTAASAALAVIALPFDVFTQRQLGVCID